MSELPFPPAENFPSDLGNFTAVAAQLPAIMWSVDLNLRITSGFGAGLQALGMHANQFVGQMLREVVTSDDHVAIAAHEKAVQGESVSYLDEFHGNSYQVHLQPLRDHAGKLIGAVGVGLDITEHKLAEQKLRLSEERFAQAFHLSPAAMVISTLADGRMLNVNDAFVEMCGLPREQLLNSTSEELDLWADREQRDALVQTVRLDGRVRNMECTFYNAKRQMKVGSVSAELVEINGVDCLLVSAVDITERHLAATQLAEANQLLEARVAERTRQLSLTNERLLLEVAQRRQVEESLRREQRVLRRLLDLQDRERKLFAYDIHDGLLQDMAGARMLMESARHKVSNLHLPKIPRELEEALDAQDKAMREGRRLMSQLRPLIIDDHGVVAAIGCLISETAEEGKLQVQFDADVQFDRLAPLLEGTLYRIVQEALTNTRRHSQASQVRVTLMQRANRVLLEIADNGIGFDFAAVPDDRFGITGIVERARLFGGKASIDTKPGRGTRILVELPEQLEDD